MIDDDILTRLEVEHHLKRLTPLHRAVVVLREGLVQPADFTEEWPATYAAIGRYVGERYRGRPFSEGAVRHIYKVGLDMLRGTFVDRRRKGRT